MLSKCCNMDEVAEDIILSSSLKDKYHLISKSSKKSQYEIAKVVKYSTQKIEVNGCGKGKGGFQFQKTKKF